MAPARSHSANTLTSDLQLLSRRVLPRMLTQVCRDPGSPAAGCWDRNWWHYKIRDFPSIILQQGGYALHIASSLPAGREIGAAFLDRLAASSARFWNDRARRHGAFEEYYPFEQGYPPLAFSTLAVAKLAGAGVVDVEEIRPGLQVAAGQLLSRFESQAANQQVAGTAAAAMIRKLAPDLVDEARFAGLLDRTFAMQESEGWFPEYDGPDLGYLAVTMDCLWDLHDATGDERCRPALDKALEFIAWFTESPPHRAGMHNSRNTDYLVPYAIARMATESSAAGDLATRVFHRLFATADQPGHFLAAVDDRYWCHYIGHSVFRALKVLGDSPVDPPSSDFSVSAFQLSAFQKSGHARLAGEGVHALVSARKGGIATVAWDDGSEASDFGWIVRRGGEEWVSHWWSPDWIIDLEADHVVTKGPLVAHREHQSSPLKHMVLRVGSWILGRRLIGLLKRVLIFKKGGGDLRIDRSIRLENGALVIKDRITGLRESDEVLRAPRSSKRHVASADSHHPEDAGLSRGVSRAEKINRDGGSFVATTRYLKS